MRKQPTNKGGSGAGVFLCLFSSRLEFLSVFLVALTCQFAIPSNQRQLILAILIARTVISVISHCSCATGRPGSYCLRRGIHSAIIEEEVHRRRKTRWPIKKSLTC